MRWLRAAGLDAAILGLVIFGSLLGGLALGGTLDTGQVDPARWWPAQAAAMAALAFVARRGRPALLLCGLSGSVSTILLFCGLAGRDWSWGGAGGLLVMSFGVAVVFLPWGRPWLGVAGVVLLSGLFLPRLLPDPEPHRGARTDLAVMTALPLFRREEGVAPILRVLGERFLVRPLDVLTPETLAAHERLLLAQPRLLAPMELVALDDWVRRGGRAVVLADPLLLWPDRLAQGDRRRPPATSLLDPLLAHWGLTLESVPGGGEAVERRFLAGGALLPLAAASHFSSRSASCRLEDDGLMALCRPGAGQVRLIADADLLDDRLWLSDPRHPDSPEYWTGDTPGLMTEWLVEPLAPAGRSGLVWVRDRAALVRALRWALLLGTAWVAVGFAIVAGREILGRRRRNGEEMVSKG